MKQTLLSFLLALLPIVASADAVEIGGIYYNLIPKGKVAEVTTNPNGYSGDIVIEESIEYGGVTYVVTKIGSGAFSGDNLSSITIPRSIATIGDGAFYYCENLNAIKISDLESWCKITYEGESFIINPLSIAQHLYLNGVEIIDLVIPSSVEEIADMAFDGGSYFATITIPNNVKKIGNNAFRNCSGVTSVTIGEDVTSIEAGAFSGCSELASLTIGSNVTYIGGGAFFECRKLTSVTIPNNVTSIGSKVFANCSNLETVIIPNSVATIGHSAFQNCGSLTSVNIPNGVSSIGENTFQYCRNLSSVSIPNSVTSIGNNAFQNCSGLTSLIIGNSVTSIGEYAFQNCSGLISLIIPNSVATIGDNAFSGCSGITSLSLGNNVTHIYNGAFAGCIGLTLLTIPNSVIIIGASAFYNCSGLTSITLGSGLRVIYDNAFNNCSDLADVFCYVEKCDDTNEDYAYYSGAIYARNNTFNGSYIDYVTLHVPSSSIDLYKNTTPWGSFGTIAGLTDTNNYYEMTVTVNSSSGTVTYGESSLTNGSQTYNVKEGTDVALTLTPNEGYSLTSVTVDGVDKTADVVNGVLNLTDIKEDMVITASFGKVVSSDVVEIDGIYYNLIPKGKIAEVTRGNYSGDVVIPETVIYKGENYEVVSIGESVFAEAVPITSITIPKTITKIGNNAFYYSDAKTLNIKDLESWLNIDFLGEYSNPLSWVDNVLIDGVKIESFVIPDGVKSIKDYAFYRCHALTSIIIPNSVTSIGNYAFNRCSGLTSIIIPNSVTTIGSYAFWGCI